MRYLQGLVPRQVNKPPPAPPPPRRPPASRRRRAVRPRSPPPGRRAEPRAAGLRRRDPDPGSGVPGCRAGRGELVGSPGRAKSRHNKREQRGSAEKLAGGDRGEGPRPGQAPAEATGGAPAGPAAPRRARSPAAAPPARGSRPESPPGRPLCPAGRRAFLPGSDRLALPGIPRNRSLPPAPRSRRAPFPGLYQTSSAAGRWYGGVGSVSPAGLAE